MQAARTRALRTTRITYGPKRVPVKDRVAGSPGSTTISQRSPPHSAGGVGHGTLRKDADITARRRTAARAATPRPSIQWANRDPLSGLMRLLHDLAPGQHDPEQEEDRHGARVDDDLDERDQLRAEQDVDAGDRDQGQREPE